MSLERPAPSGRRDAAPAPLSECADSYNHADDAEDAEAELHDDVLPPDKG